MTALDFEAALARRAQAVEAQLERLIDEAGAGEGAGAGLTAAMRHGALGGGKRLRPFLLLEAAALYGAAGPGAERVAAALELVHCYSLVHDDLPAMDDDDLRRGRPTVHRAFGEAAAILAGDGLLTLAFEVMADPRTSPDPDLRCELIGGLARAAGPAGMLEGQMLDLVSEGLTLDEESILRLQALKTGALFRYALDAGAALGRASDVERHRLAGVGVALGQVFQLADDLLDMDADPSALGKTPGKDAAAGKATLVGLYGRQKAEARLEALLAEADAALASFGSRADGLRAAAACCARRGF